MDLSIKDNSLSPIVYQSLPTDKKDEHFKFLLSKWESTTPKTSTQTKIRQRAITFDFDQKYKTGSPDLSISTDLNTDNSGAGNLLTIMHNKPNSMPNFFCIESNESTTPSSQSRQPVIINSGNLMDSRSSNFCIEKNLLK